MTIIVSADVLAADRSITSADTMLAIMLDIFYVSLYKITNVTIIVSADVPTASRSIASAGTVIAIMLGIVLYLLI